MTRYDQCDETCTTDCGHCKGEARQITQALHTPRATISTPYAVKLLRQFTQARQASGVPITHGRMKQYRDALRSLERHLWREQGLIP